jgi:hypothetical protein
MAGQRRGRRAGDWTERTKWRNGCGNRRRFGVVSRKEVRMSDPSDTPASAPVLPDRLSSDPLSPFFNAELLQRDIGVRFNGKERTDVQEYCVSEGWVRVPAGKARDRHGRPLTIKLTGTVEVWLPGEV